MIIFFYILLNSVILRNDIDLVICKLDLRKFKVIIVSYLFDKRCIWLYKSIDNLYNVIGSIIKINYMYIVFIMWGWY